MMKVQSTYAVKKIPSGLTNMPSHEMDQGYLTDNPKSLRLRRKGNSYFITRKISGLSGDPRIWDEYEIPLDQESYDDLWKIAVKKLSKTRYYYSHDDGADIRVDIFQGKLEGLAIAEVIFDNEEAYRNFKAPDWLGREIVEEKWASNQLFAGSSYDKIKKLIDKS